MVIDLAGDSDAVVYARRDKRSWPKAQTNMLRAQVSRMGTSRRLLHARRSRQWLPGLRTRSNSVSAFHSGATSFAAEYSIFRLRLRLSFFPAESPRGAPARFGLRHAKPPAGRSRGAGATSTKLLQTTIQFTCNCVGKPRWNSAVSHLLFSVMTSSFPTAGSRSAPRFPMTASARWR